MILAVVLIASAVANRRGPIGTRRFLAFPAAPFEAALQLVLLLLSRRWVVQTVVVVVMARGHIEAVPQRGRSGGSGHSQGVQGIRAFDGRR